MQIVSSGDNLHECQSLFYGKTKKNISKCRLLRFLPRVLVLRCKIAISRKWDKGRFVRETLLQSAYIFTENGFAAENVF